MSESPPPVGATVPEGAFFISYRDGAYHVSIPDYDGGWVVPLVEPEPVVAVAPQEEEQDGHLVSSGNVLGSTNGRTAAVESELVAPQSVEPALVVSVDERWAAVEAWEVTLERRTPGCSDWLMKSLKPDVGSALFSVPIAVEQAIAATAVEGLQERIAELEAELDEYSAATYALVRTLASPSPSSAPNMEKSE